MEWIFCRVWRLEVMDTRIACVQCGKLIEWQPVPAGEGPTCAECLNEAQERGCDSSLTSSSRAAHREASLSFEKTVSRSMLLPMPGVVPSAPGEMICRLEPESLRYLDLSKNLQEFLRLPPGEFLHQSLLQHLHQDDRDLAEEELRQVCEYGERNDLVLRIKGVAESWHFMRIYAQARYDPSGSVNHIRCNLKDVTDRVRAEQELSRRTEKLIAANKQLRQMNRKLKEAQCRLVQSEKLAALGTLAAGVAHEINNPLAFAINNTMVLNRDVTELFQLVGLLQQQAAGDLPGSAAELTTTISQLADKMDLPYLRENLPRLIDSTYKGLVRVARIVEKLKGFARLDRSEIGEVDVHESIDQCLVMLGESLSRLNIAVERRFGELPRIRAAVAHLNQVFLNLLVNGIDAIEAAGHRQGRIVVATRRSGAEIGIEVNDNGSGISPEILPRIFDPFFTTKPPGKGTGLGLSICHGIISEHGGRIEVDSNPDTGTCFRIRLPVQGAF
jgi:two-component system, NtrC family, sensor kinase